MRVVDAAGNPLAELVIDGEGTWTVDPATGRVTFTPDGCLAADPTPVTWEGRLADGTPVTGVLTVEYERAAEAPAPVDPPQAEQPEAQSPDRLAETGASVLTMALLGLALLGLAMLGAGTVMVRRRNGLTG